MIGRFSFDSQYNGPDHRPADVSFSSFMHKNNDQSNYSAERHKRKKKWTREDNKNVFHCYFQSNLTQRGHRKRMIEIWEESARFNATSQILADQARIESNKAWFSDRKILEICKQINSEEYERFPNSNQNTKYSKTRVPKPN